jgi:hypothetical protein
VSCAHNVAIWLVDSSAVGGDVLVGTFEAELAVALGLVLATMLSKLDSVVKHLLEVFAGCWSLRMKKRTGFAGLASSLAEEFAGHVGGSTTT